MIAKIIPAAARWAMHAASDPQPNAADSAIAKNERKKRNCKKRELFQSVSIFFLKLTLFNQRDGVIDNDACNEGFSKCSHFLCDSRTWNEIYGPCWKWDKCCQRTFRLPKGNGGKKLFVNKLLLEDGQSVSHALAVIIIDTKSITHARCYMGGGHRALE